MIVLAEVLGAKVTRRLRAELPLMAVTRSCTVVGVVPLLITMGLGDPVIGTPPPAGVMTSTVCRPMVLATTRAKAAAELLMASTTSWAWAWLAWLTSTLMLLPLTLT